MSALRGCRRAVWAKGRYLAALSLLGVAEAGAGLAIPVSAAAYRLDPGFANAVTLSASALPLPSPSVPVLPTPSLPAVLPSPPTIPNPTPPALNTPPLPVATPTLPVPTPSLPVAIPPLPTPPVLGGTSPSPSPGQTPTPVTPGGPGAGGGPSSGTGGGNPSGGGWWPAHGIQLPLFGLVLATPLDAALVAAIAALPLLFGIWVLVFGRTWNEARRRRHAQIRLAIANELGIRPRELVSVGTTALFKLREHAAFDELTGTLRRAAGMAALDREISRARRMKAPLTIAFIDLDGLKQANDRRGHKAGDELLRGLAEVLKSGLRGQDLVTRYGGDEFVCLLPDTPAAAARAKLASIQSEAEAAGIRFSLGVAQLERSDDLVSLLARADREMYEAKAGRGEIRQLRIDPGPPRTDLRSQPDGGA